VEEKAKQILTTSIYVYGLSLGKYMKIPYKQGTAVLYS